MAGLMKKMKDKAYAIRNFIYEKVLRFYLCLKMFSAIQTFCWFSLIIFLSLIQIVILWFTLNIRNIPLPIDRLIKDGVFFFFATALVGGSLFDLLDARLFPTGGLAAIACILAPSMVIFITITTYPGIIADSFLEIPPKLQINTNKLRWVEIFLTILAISYSFWVKIVRIPQQPNGSSIEEE